MRKKARKQETRAFYSSQQSKTAKLLSRYEKYVYFQKLPKRPQCSSLISPIVVVFTCMRDKVKSLKMTLEILFRITKVEKENNFQEIERLTLLPWDDHILLKVDAFNCHSSLYLKM
mmetsp:Transcript_15562/g.20521  ORF Transcript_15562/g.20521 Transcript_15562/m.20521 type:complete len:116 (-) Transcript_15562:101-448(-)